MAVKWFSETRWVDLETGEALSKSRVEREYYKVNASKTTVDCGGYILKIHTNECRRTNQTRLEF